MPAPKSGGWKSWYDLFGLLIIILVGILIYSNSFQCSFHFDDLNNIVNNSSIHNLSDVKNWWNYSPNRPISFLTLALNYHFNGLDVWGYHLVNLIIHLLNAILAGWLTLLIFSSPAMKDQPIARHKKMLAFFLALLFVSHPLATQSVTLIVQRMAALVALFYFLSLALYVKGRLSHQAVVPKILLFAGSLIAAILAMLTKENAFTLPFAILLFEFFFIRTKKLSVNFRDYRVVLLIIAFLALMLIIPLKYSFTVFEPIKPNLGHAYTLTPLNYLFTQFSVIVKYIQLLFVPVNQHLDYDFPIAESFFQIRTILSFLVLLSLLILAGILYKKQRVISFGICWFFLTLAVESGIIPIQDVIFEHRTYLPSFGFFLVLSSAFYVLMWNKYKIPAIMIFTVIVGLYATLTYQRNKVWKDELTLWNDNIAKAPELVRPYNGRGFAYNGLKQYEKAVADYTKAISIDSTYPRVYSNRAVAYAGLGQWDNVRSDCTVAIRMDRTNTKAWLNRGVAHGKLGQWQKAIADYDTVLAIDPKYTQAWLNRGSAHVSLGLWDKVVEDYTVALQLNPGNTDAFLNRGVGYMNLGKYDQAIDDFSELIRIDPKNARAYSNRGVVYFKLGQWQKVIADCDTALSIDPRYAMAYSNRGSAYGKLGEWNKAISDFTKAIEIDPDYKSAYANREVAYRNLQAGQTRQ